MKNLECRADLFFINTGVYVQTTVFCFKDGGFHANTEFELKKVPTLHSRYIYIWQVQVPPSPLTNEGSFLWNPMMPRRQVTPPRRYPFPAQMPGIFWEALDLLVPPLP